MTIEWFQEFPLVPNQSPFPSDINNSPILSNLNAGASMQPIGEVEETAAIAAPDNSMLITPQGPKNDLMSLRAQYPFLPIMPMPAKVVPLVLTTANLAYNMRIPSGAVLMYMRGNSDYFVSLQGNAEIPSTANTAGVGNTGVGIDCQSFYAPQGWLFYVNQLKELSFNSPNAGTIVTCSFWFPDQYPR